MFHGHHKRTMAMDCRIHSQAQGTARQVGQTAAGCQESSQWNSMDTTNRSTMVGHARAVSAKKHLPSTLPGMDGVGGLCKDTDGTCPGLERAWRYRPERGFHRWNFCSGKKRGDGVGKTKKGKGTKIMGITDAFGLPVAIDATSASPHEVTLVEKTLDACFLENVPEKVIGDRAYHSDKLDERLAEERGVELIAPHKNNRVKSATQDGRVLRRYRKRWKVERLFAWLQNFRRIVVRYEYHLKNFLAMVQLGCIVILLRRVLG